METKKELEEKEESIRISKKMCFYFVMNNRWAFYNKYMPKCTGKCYITRYFQYPSALSEDCVIFGGRSFGKSWELEISIIYSMFKYPNEEGLLTAFRRMHIKDREERVIGYLNNVPYFKLFFLGTNRTVRESVSRTPTYEIRLRNGHVHYGISVGDDPAAIAIQGKHPVCRFGEEFAAYPLAAWKEFQSTKDPRGSVDRFYGCVDGRTDSPFRQLDTVVEKFKYVRFHIGRIMEPFFNQGQKKEAIETLGGENGSVYLNQILAEWGAPVYGTWDLEAISGCLDSTQDPKYPGIFINKMKIIEITPQIYENMVPSMVLRGLDRLPEDGLDVILAIDAGWKEPTVILPFFYYKSKWNLTTIIELRDKVIPENQAEIIDYIADFYKAIVIPIDTTSSEGKAPASVLCNPKNKQYEFKKYTERIMWVDFKEKVVVGFKADGTEVKDRIKNASTNLLTQMFARKEFLLNYYEKMIEDFNRETQKQTNTDIIIITPTNVHIPEAFRCFAYAYLKKYHEIERPDDYYEETEFDFPFYDNVVQIFGR